jgi:hypothetical protein
MYQFRDGQILDVYGKPVDMPLNDPVRDDLYLSVPKGLTPTKGDGIFPSQPSVPSWSIPLHPKSFGPTAPLGGRAEDDQAITETAVLDKVLQRVIELAMDRVTAYAVQVIKDMLAGVGFCSSQELMQAAHSLAVTLGRNYAIVDSGASFTYVNGETRLVRAKPGTGYVSVANGQRERIAQVGSLGPIPNAQKVDSFKRTLVSVTDLVQLFGSTIFRSDGVYVETPLPSGATLVTRIGVNTPQRLYSFDLGSLERHSERIRLEYAGSPVFDMTPMIEGVREMSITG